MSWTEEVINQLKQLWNEGKSTGEIGKILGVSKNAVVGKAHRLGLESRPSPIKRNDTATETNIKKDKPKKTPEHKKEKKKDGVSLLELTSSTCRWPIGDPKDADFHFCGKEVVTGKNYCEKHMAEAFVGINKK
jgi:GcrA cell cycle regulator